MSEFVAEPRVSVGVSGRNSSAIPASVSTDISPYAALFGLANLASQTYLADRAGGVGSDEPRGGQVNNAPVTGVQSSESNAGALQKYGVPVGLALLGLIAYKVL